MKERDVMLSLRGDLMVKRGKREREKNLYSRDATQGLGDAATVHLEERTQAERREWMENWPWPWPLATLLCEVYKEEMNSTQILKAARTAIVF